MCLLGEKSVNRSSRALKGSQYARVLTLGACVAAVCLQLPAGFAEAYTLSGCANGDHCGTFRRVAANCASGYHCPGGAGDNGNTDRSLCAGAPVYQRGGAEGPVLYRVEESDGRTR